MSDLKEHLIKMGSSHPELQKHILPVLSELEKRASGPYRHHPVAALKQANPLRGLENALRKKAPSSPAKANPEDVAAYGLLAALVSNRLTMAAEQMLIKTHEEGGLDALLRNAGAYIKRQGGAYGFAADWANEQARKASSTNRASSLGSVKIPLKTSSVDLCLNFKGAIQDEIIRLLERHGFYHEMDFGGKIIFRWLKPHFDTGRTDHVPSAGSAAGSVTLVMAKGTPTRRGFKIALSIEETRTSWELDEHKSIKDIAENVAAEVLNTAIEEGFDPSRRTSSEYRSPPYVIKFPEPLEWALEEAEYLTGSVLQKLTTLKYDNKELHNTLGTLNNLYKKMSRLIQDSKRQNRRGGFDASGLIDYQRVWRKDLLPLYSRSWKKFQQIAKDLKREKDLRLENIVDYDIPNLETLDVDSGTIFDDVVEALMM